MRALLVLLAAQTWTVGSRVHVTAAVYARTDTLGVGPKTLRVVGDKGTLVQGPAGSSTGFGASWYVHYTTPPDGWSTMQYLALDSLAPADTVNRSWTLGLRVKTTGTAVYVRADSTCCSQVVESLPVGIKGTLVGGPWKATDNGVRWRVAWDAHTTGWSRQELMTRDSTAVPPPPPPPPPTVAKVGLNVAGSVAITVIGGTFQGLAFPMDAAGNVVVTPVTWRASAPAVATVSGTGLVTAVAIGTDTIRASAGGQSSFFLVFVSPPSAPPPPTPISWGVRAGSLDALRLAQPSCVVTWTPGVTTTCGPYARIADSTGAVLQHFLVTVTVQP